MFGEYLIGSVVEDVWNTFTAFISAPAGYNTAAVMFDANFNGVMDAGDYTGLVGSDGWTWNLNVSDLSGDKTLSIWAQKSGGTWSDAATFTIDTLPVPAWMDPDLTDITFNASAGKYEIDSLIGKRFGVDTPSDWPEWLAERNGEPTFNGIHFGVLVEADGSLDGMVHTGRIAPAFGWALLGMGQTYAAPVDLGYQHLSTSIDLFQFIDKWKSPTKFDQLMDSPAAGFYDSRNRKDWFPKVTLSYDGQIELNSDLQFSHYAMTFGASVTTLRPLFKLETPLRPLFKLETPPLVFPLWAPPDISLVLSAHLGFSPTFDIEYTQNLNFATGQVAFDHVSAEIGFDGELGVTGEVAVLGGVAKGGVEIAGLLSMGFAATYNGGWTYSIPAEVGLNIDFVGSVLWGLFSGKIDVYDWTSGPINLWSSGGSATSSLLAGEAGGLTDPAYTLAPIDHAMARSTAGEVAYAYVPVSLDGTAQPIAVQRLIGGIWQTPEVIANSNNHRGTAARRPRSSAGQRSGRKARRSCLHRWGLSDPHASRAPRSIPLLCPFWQQKTHARAQICVHR